MRMSLFILLAVLSCKELPEQHTIKTQQDDRVYIDFSDLTSVKIITKDDSGQKTAIPHVFHRLEFVENKIIEIAGLTFSYQLTEKIYTCNFVQLSHETLQKGELTFSQDQSCYQQVLDNAYVFKFASFCAEKLAHEGWKFNGSGTEEFFCKYEKNANKKTITSNCFVNNQPNCDSTTKNKIKLDEELDFEKLFN